MATWRETAPAPVVGDLDGLLATALKSVQMLFVRDQGFAPYALAIDNAGEVGPFRPGDDLGARPEPAAVLDSLYTAAAQRRDEVRTVAFVAQVSVDQTDAVRVELEHRDGGPGLTVVVPVTRRSRTTDPVTFGRLAVAEAPRRTWA